MASKIKALFKGDSDRSANGSSKVLNGHANGHANGAPKTDAPVVKALPPPRPPMSDSPPRLLIIGAGSRGRAYGRASVSSSNGIVAAVAEPVQFKRETFGRTYIWGNDPPKEGESFSDWRDFLAYELKRRERVAAGETDVPPGVDAAFVCVLDEQHAEVVIGLAPLRLHIMCEKPLACTLEDCLRMYKALEPPGEETKTVFSIGHVLRYSPHNILLRKLLLEEKVIGDILSVVHTEPVGWWHFTHSYVRGNWRREKTSAPSLLTKSCHDIDLILWMLCSPTKAGEGEAHLPSTISSSGSLQFFKKRHKPATAGASTNCLTCPLGDDGCKYSAKKIYLENEIIGLKTGNTGWPISIVLPDIESLPTMDARKEGITTKLAEDYTADTPAEEVSSKNWFGRCVFESDNDVNDEQVVVMTWEDDPDYSASSSEESSSAATAAAEDEKPLRTRHAKTATFHMVAQTKKVCQRYSHFYGTNGELTADSRTITIEDFNTGKTTSHHPTLEDLGHGGGDKGLTRQFVLAVDMVKNHGWTAERAQNELIGCTVEEAVRSHAVVFAAEEARKEKRVVEWESWWSGELQRLAAK